MKLIRDVLVEGTPLTKTLNWVKDIPDMGDQRFFVVGYEENNEKYMDTVVAEGDFTPEASTEAVFTKNGVTFPNVKAVA